MHATLNCTLPNHENTSVHSIPPPTHTQPGTLTPLSPRSRIYSTLVSNCILHSTPAPSFGPGYHISPRITTLPLAARGVLPAPMLARDMPGSARHVAPARATMMLLRPHHASPATLEQGYSGRSCSHATATATRLSHQCCEQYHGSTAIAHAIPAIAHAIPNSPRVLDCISGPFDIFVPF